MILDLLKKLYEKLIAGGLGDGHAIAVIIYSPLVEFLVKVSPNKYDDMILDLLRQLIPQPK